MPWRKLEGALGSFRAWNRDILPRPSLLRLGVEQPDDAIRREPALPEHEAIVPEHSKPIPEFAVLEDEPDDEAVRAKALNQNFRRSARQAALDPDDDLGM